MCVGKEDIVNGVYEQQSRSISSHVGPRYGEKHEQVKLVEVLVHVPPFLQGLGAQRSPAKGNEPCFKVSIEMRLFKHELKYYL